MKNTRKRKRFYIDPQVQRALVIRVVVHWSLFVMTTFFIVGFLQSCLEHPTASLTEMAQYALARNSVAILVAVTMLPIFVYDSIKLSNRFAGPVMRLRQAMAALAVGEDVEPLVFRAGDFWREIAQNFNMIAKRLRESQQAAAAPSDSTSQAEEVCLTE